MVTEKLKQDIKEFFLNINIRYKLFSPLADGADRLVADIYLDVFKDNAHLVVPMPFDKKRYMEDFD